MASVSQFFSELQVVGGSYMNGSSNDERLLSADLELTVDQISELSFKLNDPNWVYLASFGKDGPLKKDAQYRNLMLRVASYSCDGGPTGMGGTTLKLQPRGLMRMRDIQGALTRNDISPTQFVRDSAANCGMTFLGQDSQSRPTITRDVGETEQEKNDNNEWTTNQRLAAEEGFLIFERYNELVFASPKWLYDNQPVHTLGLGDSVKDRHARLLEVPDIEVSASKNTTNEVSFKIPMTLAEKILPGHAVHVLGLPAGLSEKKLLVTKVGYPLAGVGDLSITARDPWEIEKQETKEQREARENAGKGGAGGGGPVGPGRPNIDTSGMTIQESMIAVVKAKFPMIQVTSTTRNEPGSYHDVGSRKAVDFSNGGDAGTPEMYQLAKFIFETYLHQTHELIHYYWEHNIGDMQDVGRGGSYYSSGTMNQHRNHVHWAMSVRA